MKKFQRELRRYINVRSLVLVLILLVVSLLWFRYLAGILLAAVFAPISFLTVRYSKMVPHVSIESNTSTSILMGFLFGPPVGFLYTLTVGGACYLMNSFVSLTYISTLLLAALASALAGFLHIAIPGMAFSTAFIIAIVLRTIIAFFWFGLIGTSPLENMTHQSSQMISNLIIYLPLLGAIYDIVKNFV